MLKPREGRVKLLARARMRSGAGWSDVCVVNASTRGVGLQAANPPEPGHYVEIRRGANLLLIGRVIWTKGHRFGVNTQPGLDRRHIGRCRGNGARGRGGDRASFAREASRTLWLEPLPGSRDGVRVHPAWRGLFRGSGRWPGRLGLRKAAGCAVDGANEVVSAKTRSALDPLPTSSRSDAAADSARPATGRTCLSRRRDSRANFPQLRTFVDRPAEPPLEDRDEDSEREAPGDERQEHSQGGPASGGKPAADDRQHHHCACAPDR